MIFYDYDHISDKYLDVEAYYARQYSGFDMRPHRHPYIEIMYVESGSCSVEIISDRLTPMQNSHQIGKEQFIVISSGCMHKLYIPPDQKCMLYTVEFKLVDGSNGHHGLAPSFEKLLKECPDLQNVLFNPKGYIILADHKNILAVIKRIQGLMEEYKNNQQPQEHHLIQIESICLMVSISAMLSENVQSLRSMSYIKEALSYMDKHYDQADFSITAMAEVIGIHRTYLMSLFKKHIKYSINSYIQELRVKKAVKLIQNSNISVYDMCFECGYNNRQSFYTNFKNIMGIGPLEYKKTCKNPSVYSYSLSYQNQFDGETD